MPWQFVGVTEQMERLTSALGHPHPGPIIVTGDPGSGRTTLLSRLPLLVDPRRDEVLPLDADAGARTLAGLPAALSTTLRSGRRPVLVLDDAHRADHALLRAIRDAHRQLGAAVVVSRPDGTSEGTLDCLRYEPDTRFIPLHPLSVHEVGTLLGAYLGDAVHPATASALHTVTGGNPGLLAELAQAGVLTTDPARPAGHDNPGEPRPDRAPHGLLSERAAHAVRGALDGAWQALALDEADLLSTLAPDSDEQAAAVRAFVMLVRGRARQGLEYLDSLPEVHRPPHCSPRLTLTRALLLGLGLGRTTAAEDLLLKASKDSTPPQAQRLTAYRAWLLALAGRTADAAAILGGLPTAGDMETEVFVRAAAATVALVQNWPASAIFHLRRALIGAQRLLTVHPWLPALLTSSLIDASLLAGRITEATELVADFHASAQGAGWDVALALTTLIEGAAGDGRVGGPAD